MRTEIKTYSYPGGELQRVQVVSWDSWEELEFLQPKPDENALDCFARIYREHLVPACPALFGNMVLFQIPEDVKVDFPQNTKRYGAVADRLTAAAAAMERGVTILKGKPVFRDDRVRAFWEALEKRSRIRIVSGWLPITTIIPIANRSGFLTETEKDAAMKVNASFFIMDRFDCATAFDHIGTPLGLLVKNGVVENPPLYNREALLVKKDGSVEVRPVSLKNLELEIRGQRFRVAENAAMYSRPGRFRTPGKTGKSLVIVGGHVAAVKERGSVPIPASGFVLCPEGPCQARPGDRVVLRGMEDVRFGIQVGNSILKNGAKTNRFYSRFYNIRRLEPIPFPPSLYPPNFRRDRAARIALGADGQGKPMLLWAEGAGKLEYKPGTDSRGATLEDMANFCADAGMVNAVNLDGGGSAQILLQNQRSLRISDRDPKDDSDAERPIPLGLMVR